MAETKCTTEESLMHSKITNLISAVEQYLYQVYSEAPDGCKASALRHLGQAFADVDPNSPVTMTFRRWECDLEMDPRIILSIPRVRVTLDRMKPGLEDDAQRAKENEE